MPVFRLISREPTRQDLPSLWPFGYKCLARSSIRESKSALSCSRICLNWLVAASDWLFIGFEASLRYRLAELVLKLKYLREEDSMNAVVETYDWDRMILEPLNGCSFQYNSSAGTTLSL